VLSRRSLLVAGAGGLVLAACGGGSGAKTGADELNLLLVTPQAVAGKATRLAMVLQDGNRDYVVPRRATVQFGPTQDRFTSPKVEATIHDDAKPAPGYLTISATLSPTGTVWAQVDADGRKAVAPIQVVDRLPGLAPGGTLPAVATPSPAGSAGVDPICTRQPACPWHDLSLDAALKEPKPLAVLVATPAYCQTAVCGPVLDTLLAASQPFADRVRFVHVEVYAQRPTSTEVTATPLSPAVKAMGLESEPMLFLAAPGGLVRERLEGLYGAAEAQAALQRLVGS
jgi:hypothetical protein